MGGNYSLVDLGKLSKPATVLIEKISSAIGIVYEPHHVRRMARASADAEKIRALSQVELTEIQARTFNRLIVQEERKQENIEKITAQAAEALPNDAKTDDLSEDWIAHFFKQCDAVSDEQMQSLWASLLAGEATKPGTYSKRTVNFIGGMDKRDAELFTKFCACVWNIAGPTALVFDHDDQVYEKMQINFGTLQHLSAIGLISLQALGGFEHQRLGKHLRVYYGHRAVNLEFASDNGNSLILGKSVLTDVGVQLCSLCKVEQNDEFFDYVLGKWSAKEIIISTPIAWTTK